ncbi:unnamed protein product [Clavelina lepadiformis]|uniref:Cyclin-H n=1 Tax=Clavelina lepadiformis TaxID=159417 RepID=A0ABP0EZU4_CLALP
MFHSSTQKQFWTFSTEEELIKLRKQANVLYQEKYCLSKQNTSKSVSVGNDRFFLTVDEHQALVHYYEKQLRDFCWKFNPPMPLNTVGTACCYMKRLYLRKSVMEYHPRLMFLVCIWLACKIEEFNISMEQFVKNISWTDETIGDAVLTLELILIQELNFHLTIHNAFRPMEGFFIDIKTRFSSLNNPESLRKNAKDFIVRSLSTDVCLMFTPCQIALSALLSSASKQEINIDRYVTDVLFKGQTHEMLSQTIQRIKKIRTIVKNADAGFPAREKIKAVEAKLENCYDKDKDPTSYEYMQHQHEIEQENTSNIDVRLKNQFFLQHYQNSVEMSSVSFTAFLQQTIVVPGTLMYDLNWKDVKTPVYRSFYLFNVTNKEEFLAQTPGKFVKPILQEIGPYTYREFLVKENVEYLDYNKTYPQQVYYKQTATFYFDPERSNGSKDDVLTTLNFIVPLIPALLENLIHNDGILKAAYVYLNKLIRETKTELLFTMSVDEYLFGFQNSLFDALIDIVAPDSGIDKFGLFLLTNMSIGWRDYQVYTGHNNHELTSVITKYKNMSELPYWNGTTCNMINGTDGTMTPPFLDKTKPIYFFVDEMCRSLYANFEEDYTVHNIKGWKYTVPAEVFQSPLKNTNNECFCLDPNHETCQHDGATLVGSCLFGVPLLVSFPHFLYGDGFYASKLVGMHPNKPDHEMALVFEPVMCHVVRVAYILFLCIIFKNASF